MTHKAALSLSETQIAKRIATYGTVANELALLSNLDLLNFLEEATQSGTSSTSMGGTTMVMTIGANKIFVKKVRLTDLEQQSENMMSTANLFSLPSYCQYGIGSPGFGVWRELATHTVSSNWVLADECLNFPLMYHWRLLPRLKLESISAQALTELEQEVKYWEGSPAVRARLEANLAASADIVLFLEYIPQNLHQWFSQQLGKGGAIAESAFSMVENNLKAITAFTHSRGLLHFDAHFKNILTDGHCLYFTDFGLASSTRFELSEAEFKFFLRHHNYDQCYTLAYLVEWILTRLFGPEHYATILHEYAAGKGSRTLTPPVAALIKRYAPIAVIMHEFQSQLKKDKTTPYPTSECERVYAEVAGLPLDLSYRNCRLD